MSNDATAKGKTMARLIRERAEANRAAYDEAFGTVVMSAADRVKLAASGADKKPRTPKP